MGTDERFGLEGFLFYPYAFVEQSGSPWLAGIYVIALVWGLRHWRENGIRVLVTLVLVQLFLGQIHQTKVDRHILPVFPALYLLVGCFAASWWNSAASWRDGIRFWSPRVLTGLVLVHSLGLSLTVPPPPERRREDRHTGSYSLGLTRLPGNMHREVEVKVAYHVARILGEAHAAMIIGTWESVHPPCLDWLLVTRAGILAPPQAGYLGRPAQERRLAAVLRERQTGTLKQWLLPVITRAEIPGTIRTVYFKIPDLEGLRFLASSLKQNETDRVVVITSTDGKPRLPLSLFGPILAAASFRPLESVALEFGQLRIDVYGRD